MADSEVEFQKVVKSKPYQPHRFQQPCVLSPIFSNRSPDHNSYNIMHILRTTTYPYIAIKPILKSMGPGLCSLFYRYMRILDTSSKCTLGGKEILHLVLLQMFSKRLSLLKRSITLSFKAFSFRISGVHSYMSVSSFLTAASILP